MIRESRILATPDLVVRRLDHPPGVSHADPDREVASGWAVSFVDAGAFEVSASGPAHQARTGRDVAEPARPRVPVPA